MPFILQLSRKLKLFRKKHGITQEEFATASGFSLKFYQQIEAGNKKQIWVETVERIASAYGLSLVDFLGADALDKSKKPKDILQSAIHKSRAKSQKGKSPA